MKKTEKKEKEGQEVRKSADILHPRVQAMLDAINKNSEARESLRSLEEEGCDRSVILTKLFFYCGGTEEELRVGLKEALDFRDRFAWVSDRLVEDAKWVEVMLEKCREYGVAGIYGFDDLPQTLKAFAGLMSTLGKPIRGRLKNVRLGNEKKTRSKSAAEGRVNPRAGRTHHLVYLANYVKGESEEPVGKHYRLLSKLLTAVRKDEYRGLADIVDSLRNSVGAFVRRHPDDASYIAAEAAEEFEEKNPKPQPSARN